MTYPAGTLLMNMSGYIGMIIEVKKRPLFKDEYNYIVEWYARKQDGTIYCSLSDCGVGITKRYVQRLQEYKYAEKLIG
jgi:hypothetical protein